MHLASGKAYYINSASVLNATTLGSGVVNSSLTKIGALSGGTAGFVKVDASGNLTADSTTYLTAASTLDASKLSGTIPSGVLGNSTVYVGTTGIALNRSSATQGLTGITSIDTSNTVVADKTYTLSVSNSPQAFDTFTGTTYSSVHYLIQLKQGSAITTTNLVVNYDGTNVNVTEYGVVDGLTAADYTLTATNTGASVSVTVSSTTGATTNVVMKALATYIKA